MLKNRLLSVILTVTILLGTVITVLPIAFAEEEETCSISSFNELKECFEDDGDVKAVLIADVDESFATSPYDNITSEITLGEGNKILDLNGHTFRICDTVNRDDQGETCRKPTMNLFCIPEEASLTVTDESSTDSVYTGTIKFDAYMIGGEAKAVPICSFSPGEYTCVAVRNIFLVESGGELTINKGTYECGREKKQHLTESKRYKFDGYAPGENDNDFCDTFTCSGSDYSLWHSKDAYQVVFGAPVVVNGGKVTINNGHFLARGCSRSNLLCNWSLYALGNTSSGDPTRAAVMITGKKSQVVINNGLFRGRDGAQALFIKESIRDTISLEIYSGYFTTEKGVDYIRVTEATNPDRGYAAMFKAYTFIPTEYVKGVVTGVGGDPVILDNIFGRGFSAYTSDIYIKETPRILAQSTNETCTVNETVTLSVKAEKATSYYWQKYAQTSEGLEPLGEAVCGNKNGTYTITSDLQEEAVYICTVKNAVGSTDSEPISVKFTPEEQNYDIWVCGKQLSTSDHGDLVEDGYTFDVDENMLYLYNFTDTAAYNVNSTVCSSIYTTSGALNITLTGENKISNTISSRAIYYGLYAGSNINLFGEGTLEIALDKNKASNTFVGIYSTGGQIKFWDAPKIRIDGSVATKSFTGILSYGDIWFDGDGATRIICSSFLDTSKNVGVAIVNGNGIEGNGKGVIKYNYGRIDIFSNGNKFRPFKGYTEFDEFYWYKVTVDSEKLNRKDTSAINTTLNNTAKTVNIKFCEYYDLSVNGMDVNEENFFGADGNGGYWTYDDDTDILYLKNVKITSGTAADDTYKTVCGITTEKENLEICLVGNNSIDFSDKTSVSAVCGINSSGNITFTGSGNLTVTSDATAVNSYIGINCDGLLTFNGEGSVRIDFANKTDKTCIGIMYTSDVVAYQSGKTNILGGLVCKQGNVVSVVGKGMALWDLGSNGDKTLSDGMTWRYGSSESLYTETKDSSTAYTGLSSGCKYAAFIEQNTLYVSLKTEDFPLSGKSRLTAGSTAETLADTDDYTLKTANTAGKFSWQSKDSDINTADTYKYGESYYTYLKLIVKNNALKIDTEKTYTFIINGVECSATCVKSDDDYLFTVTSDCVAVINGDKIILTAADVTLSNTSFTYNGNVKKPTVTVKDEYGNTLTKGKDYTLTYSSGCKAVGTYYATVKGIGEYEGTVKKSFKIVCTHKWDAGKITTAATCTKTGVKTYTCTICNSTKTEKIAAKGHKLTKSAYVAATCTSTGHYTYYTCSTCGKVYVDSAGTHLTTVKEQTIKMKAHKITYVSAKAATCTTAGNIAHYKCTVCSKVFTDSKGANETTVKAVTLKAKSHYWSSPKVTKAATCTKTGVKTYTCTRKGCTATKTATIPAKGHTITKVAYKAATCTATGHYTYYKCTTCSKVYVDSAATHITTVKEQTIAKKAHKVTKVAYKAATCTSTGHYTYYKCSTCGKVFVDSAATKITTVAEQTIEMKSHKIVYVSYKAPTATTDGNKTHYKCTLCGKLFKDSKGVTELTAADVTIKATGK